VDARDVSQKHQQPGARVGATGVRDEVRCGVRVREGSRGGVEEAVGIVGVVEVGAEVEGRDGRRIGVGSGGRRRGGRAQEDAGGGRGGGGVVRVCRRPEAHAELEEAARGWVRISVRLRHGRRRRSAVGAEREMAERWNAKEVRRRRKEESGFSVWSLCFAVLIDEDMAANCGFVFVGFAG
jgi:hypothetical protein